ncbi:Protein CER1-like 2 [Morella rubra]|uniref:Protein CER1-like 2 n=1 Tax=Morella rubra TaxID=262757 RepID=A0A6A1WIG0_9ROSI|nr:Protein CER1-like 2 [Morella rubra]
MDLSTDELYETSLKSEAESSLDVVHLTHLTTPESIYHHWLGFASLPPRPLTSKWYLWLIWPVTQWSMMNWLPRRVMSAWRIAAIVHAFEGWNEHECGLYSMSDVEKVWQASPGHGFQPLVFPTQFKYN